MVLLFEKFSKFYTKLEKNHVKGDDGEDLSASLATFHAKVSDFLNQILLDTELGSGILPFSWIKRCLEMLPVIDKALAKLVMEIDYPISRWESASVEEYLSYSLHMLEFFNLISSSLSHLGLARLELMHGLSLTKTASSAVSLKPIKPEASIRHLTKEERVAEKFSSGKEMVINKAVVEVKSIGFCLCAVVLSSLCGDAKPFFEIKKMASGLDSRVFEGVMEKGIVAKELKEVNDAVASLAAAATVNGKRKDFAADELERKLEELEKVTEELGKTVDQLFSRTLSGRNQLLDTRRQA